MMPAPEGLNRDDVAAVVKTMEELNEIVDTNLYGEVMISSGDGEDRTMGYVTLHGGTEATYSQKPAA